MKKKNTKEKYLAGHQRSWVWGRHSVREILAAQRWPVRELYLDYDLPDTIQNEAAEQGVKLGATVYQVNSERIRTLSGAPDHQGYLMRMGPFPYADLSELFATPSERPLYLLVNNLRDPHNFGAILRSAAAFAADAVIACGEHRAPINNHVVRASAGALNRVSIAAADKTVALLDDLKAQGIRCVAATPRDEPLLRDCDLTQPVAILLGNEGAGLPPELIAQCDSTVSIPQYSSLDSINVAAAAAILLYEVNRQRFQGTTP